MQVEDLINELTKCDPKAEVRFAEYECGQTRRWFIRRCCNIEHQDSIKQVWFSRDTLAEVNDAVLAPALDANAKNPGGETAAEVTAGDV